MLIKKTERQARRSRLAAAFADQSGAGVDRRTFLRRSGIAAGSLAALGELVLPPNAAAMREGDATDGVSAAHLYHIIYPSGTPQLRWYVRVSDGRLHAIRRAGKSYAVTATIDNYNSVPAINPPTR